MKINYYTGAMLNVRDLPVDSNCIGCDHKGLDPIRPFRLNKWGKQFVVQCPNCLLLQVSPVPSESELNQFYVREYRKEGTAGYSEPNFTSRHLSQAHYIVDQLNLMGKVPLKILDVGAGFGQLLNILKTKLAKSNFFAAELDERCLETLALNGIIAKQVLIGEQNSNPFGTDFDLIICSHVLEHVRSVRRFLNVLSGMLRVGGCFFVEVPNCGLPYDWGEDDPQHLSLFSQQSLVKTVEGVGFAVRECHAGGPNATHYINPTLFRESINAIEISKKLLKSILPKSLIALISRTQGIVFNNSQQTAKLTSLLRSNEELIDNENSQLFYTNNPNGIFLRIFAHKK